MSKKTRSYKRLFAHVENHISKTSNPVITFDVFDTLFHREVDPDLIVISLCNWLDSLARRLGWDVKCDALEARQIAYEKLIYKKAEAGFDLDVNLDDLIPHWLAEFTDIEPVLAAKVINILKERELLLEKAFVYPNLDMLEYIKALRERKIKTLYISDMYLGNEIVSTLLEVSGFKGLFDQGYVSGDVNYLKRTGNLFKHVRQKQNLRNSDWLHLGDSIEADGRAPNKENISSIVIRTPKFAADYSLKKSDYSLLKKYPDWSGQLIANIAGRQHAYLNDAQAIGFNKIGPAIANLAHSILETAVKVNTKQVYFFSREGKLILEMAKQIVGQSSDPAFRNLRLEYLEVSRLVALLGAAKQLGTEEIASLLLNTETRTLVDALKPLGFSYSELVEHVPQNLIGQISSPVLGEVHTNNVVLALVQSEKFQVQFKSRASEITEPYLSYLESKGLFKTDNAVFVDLGWGGQIQQNLHKTINTVNKSFVATGIYFGINHHAVHRHNSQNRFHGQFVEPHSRNWSARSAYEMVQGLETLTRASHGSVVSFSYTGGRARPVFREDTDPARVSEKQDEQFICAVQDGALKYGEEYARLVELLCVPSKHTLRFAEQQIEALIRYPSKIEAEAIGRLTNAADFGSEEFRSINLSGLSFMKQIRNALWVNGVIGLKFWSKLQPFFIAYLSFRSLPNRYPTDHSAGQGALFGENTCEEVVRAKPTEDEIFSAAVKSHRSLSQMPLRPGQYYSRKQDRGKRSAKPRHFEQFLGFYLVKIVAKLMSFESPQKGGISYLVHIQRENSKLWQSLLSKIT